MTEYPQLGELREARLPQGTMTYHERGEGEPVVFVHGFLVDGALWRSVVPAVSERARCLVPNLPLGSHRIPMEPQADLSAHGLAKLLVDFLDNVGVERATFVGNDSGGALTQIMATTYPDRVARLVLTDCDAFENFPPKMFRYLAWGAKLPGGLTLLTKTMSLPGSARSPIAYGWLTKKPLPKAILEHWTEPVKKDRGVRRDAGKVIRGFHPSQTLDAAAKLGSLKVPALIVWAPEDRFFPYEHGERLAKILGAKLVPVRDSRTFVSEDQPAVVATAIKEFLAATKDAEKPTSAAAA